MNYTFSSRILILVKYMACPSVTRTYLLKIYRPGILLPLLCRIYEGINKVKLSESSSIPSAHSTKRLSLPLELATLHIRMCLKILMTQMIPQIILCDIALSSHALCNINLTRHIEP